MKVPTPGVLSTRDNLEWISPQRIK